MTPVPDYKVRKHFPPGPRQQPLVGNLKDIPSGGNEWDAYEALGKKCGSDVVYFNALGSHLVVLNKFEAARELLDKKGSIYSSRPRLVMINELWGWDWNLIMMPLGKAFQAYRKVVQQEFQPSVVAESHRIIMARETIAMLGRLMKTPDHLPEHLKQMAGATIMAITYGHHVTSADDEFVALAEAVREHAEKTPGSSIVDVIPLLKYLPSWFPGAQFQRDAEIMRRLSLDMRLAPYNAVKKLIDYGTAVPSIITRLIQSESPLEGVPAGEFAMNAAGVIYSATVSALLNFALAMSLYPEVQERAQQDLDRVVGRDRLPTFEDRQELPYVSNLVKETLRWKAVSPLALLLTARCNSAMLHDESVYTSPHEFDPNRYNPTPKRPTGEPDPSRAAFGFGRRICPGRYFADDALFLAIACMLHVFKISDPSESRERAQVQWSSGLVSVPSPFPYKIIPRFSGAQDLSRVSERCIMKATR
ncbi:cytochrome P450 [Dichomitus squalens LYAD-421 SS1]|uniref:Cytochrome P450 n=1 Tax=Dichomitus squalens (strain LYAD-421) TaxID=732165 RepID=R7SMQ5_DICSQ|nr:cytochrome P450 [Dichomitus squalens LYAD-421 SS1]EJF56272.1 cytochrome P450 [Dichomitus squalens LYAD-421 SS1]